MEHVAAGGVEAANAHGANLVVTVDAPLDLYVSSASFEQLRGASGIRWEPDEPNVVLHVLPAELPDSAVEMMLGGPVVPVAAAAADLLDQGDQRAVLAATELLARAGVRS
jgi:hypothetical protein